MRSSAASVRGSSSTRIRHGACDHLSPSGALGGDGGMIDGYPSPRTLLEKYGLRAKKSWGQNFLGDDGILSDIARLAAPRPGELVVELGAGLGHLTARLAARGAKVVAVERDRDMAEVL